MHLYIKIRLLGTPLLGRNFFVINPAPHASFEKYKRKGGEEMRIMTSFKMQGLAKVLKAIEELKKAETNLRWAMLDFGIEAEIEEAAATVESDDDKE